MINDAVGQKQDSQTLGGPALLDHIKLCLLFVREFLMGLAISWVKVVGAAREEN